MSYHADHLAWQQRVGHEMTIHRRTYDNAASGDRSSGFQPDRKLMELYQR